MGKANRRAFLVEVALLRVGPDQPIQVARLELVGILRHCFQIANPKVACASLENVAEGERAERGVTARAAAANGQPILVNRAPLHKVARAVHTVVHVHDAPLSLQPLTIGPAVAGAAAVVHVEDGDPPAGPILDRQVERAGSGPCRSTVDDDQQWR